MPLDTIYVKGAREHNLKNIDVTIPRDKMVVITGLSGSGKSSLAFDTIYAEGQRRYVESLSAYARQFLGRMEKPDVDYIEGLSPAISIDQKGASHNPRSIVGTVTEIFDYLRLLFSRVGKPHCPQCGRPITRQTVQQIVDAVLDLPMDTRFMVLAPLVRHKKGEHLGILDDLRKQGFVRARVNGDVRDLSETITLNKKKWHDVEAVVDRLAIVEGDDDQRTRVADSVESALRLGSGVVLIAIVDGEELVFSEHMACAHCSISFPEIEPRTFSFNSPHGACPTCTGLGSRLEVDPELVIPNPNLSIDQGAIQPWARAGTMSPWYASTLNSVARKYGFETDAPVKSLKKEHVDLILNGAGEKVTVRHVAKNGRVFEFPTEFEGVVKSLARRYRDTESEWVRGEIVRYMTAHPCTDCQGRRLKPESLSVLIERKSIMQVTGMNVVHAMEWVGALEGQDGRKPLLSQRDLTIAAQIVKEIQARLRFLVDIGLDYLTLDRSSGTLSGGEAQRIRLATQIGSGLMGVLYVCDEPSVGLHAADDERLIKTLFRLRDLGNTVIIVEHDEAVMRSADWIIDLGPGAGEHGGYLVAAGPVEVIEASPESITGMYLSGRREIPIPESLRRGNGEKITITGARENNLKRVNVEIPLGQLVCITGVSGSGKSTLINEVLYKKLAQVFYRARERPGKFDEIKGLEHIDKVVNIDQSPIGRTPRSNPTTYTGAFTPIRELFASVPEARARGYTPGRFSFNVKGGRCEACAGEGYVRIEMQFLPDVTVPCEVCNGERYNREALEIHFKGKSIAEVLDMTVNEAQEFFANIPKVNNKLKTMRDVGLGYIRLGQPATTLSGGEAQRVKLSTELSKRSTGRTLYILDEPTTGLSFEDARALLEVLHKLVDAGNTVVLIEHHLDLIKNADWVIDLGPGAGDKGGEVVATGTPEEVAANPASVTGQWLASKLRPPASPKTASGNGRRTVAKAPSRRKRATAS
jgi:excinuclease ABC subunit A